MKKLCKKLSSLFTTHEVKSVYLFTNGKALFYDNSGNQMGEVQSLYHTYGFHAVRKYVTRNTKIVKDLDYNKLFDSKPVWQVEQEVSLQ